MKKADFICIASVILFFSPFIISDSIFDFYWNFNKEHAYLMTFIKFSILAPFGEMLGLRIKTGKYYTKGFGLLPRAFVWGLLGITIKMAFDIFANGVPAMLISMGLNIPENILLQELSWLTVFTALSIGVTLNIFYAPFLMVTHKITDEHIQQTKGSIKRFFSPLKFGEKMINLNWDVQWNFVFKKTIPFFWIPAQSINFLFPDDLRILIAAFYSIILGVLLAIASLKSNDI